MTLLDLNRINGYKDGAEMKTDVYESDTFMEEMAETWEGLKPLYEQLHAYVRHKLVERYDEIQGEPSAHEPGLS